MYVCTYRSTLDSLIAVYKIAPVKIQIIVKFRPPHRQCMDREDPLLVSNARLATYQALCSPAYLVHTTPDPIHAAFRLVVELEDNATKYRHLAANYMQLKNDVSAFAVDLIGTDVLIFV